MPIHPRLIDDSEKSTHARWLANAIMCQAKATLAWQMMGVLSIDLHSAPFLMTPELADDMVRWCFEAGWPYGSWHTRDRQTRLVLAREADTVAETLERFWRLELQGIERPGDVDFHTMKCAVEPSRITTHDWQRVRQRVLFPIAVPGRAWSQIRGPDMAYVHGAHNVYKYRFDLFASD